MSRNITQWHSPRLNKSMEICVYGTYGLPILMFPSAAADYLEYERFHLIDSVQRFIPLAYRLEHFMLRTLCSVAQTCSTACWP